MKAIGKSVERWDAQSAFRRLAVKRWDSELSFGEREKTIKDSHRKKGD